MSPKEAPNRTLAEMGATAIVPLRIDPGELGAALAHLPSDLQGRALKAFCRELRSACGTNYNAEMQLHYVNKELEAGDRELLSCLGLP